MHSKRFRVALAEQAREVMALREANGDKDLSDDETFEQTLSLLAACTSAFVNLFDAEGNLTDEKTRTEIKGFMAGFAAFAGREHGK